MKFPLSFTLALLIPAASAFAGDNAVLTEMYRFAELFDGAAVEVSPPPAMPMPMPKPRAGLLPFIPQGGDWGVPEIQGVPVESVTKQRDVLKEFQVCEAADYVYARRPLAAEAVAALDDCLSALSKRYGLSITAAEGRGGLVLMIGGLIPPGSTVKSDLETALHLRDGTLFGHSVKLIDLERPAADSRTSSLQPVIDQCGLETPELETAAAFARLFGSCLKTAKGIAITGLRPDPADALVVLVYSRDPLHIRAEMNGVLRIQTADGVTRLRVRTQSELKTDTMLKSDLSRPTYLPR